MSAVIRVIRNISRRKTKATDDTMEIGNFDFEGVKK
jgi:hypothetical protein